MDRLRTPVATYRLQLNRGFRFSNAQAIVPYLDLLGISDLYASPILRARRSSTHCYDVTDPTRLNPDLGAKSQFEALAAELRARGMGLLVDIVPNHMAASAENPWWSDVLEHGPSSPCAAFFDIDWSPPDAAFENRVLLPILGRPYRQALENRELVLTVEQGGLFLRYHETRLPLTLESYALVISHGLDRLRDRLGAANPFLRGIELLLEAIDRLPSRPDTGAANAAGLRRRQQAIKLQLRRTIARSEEVRAFLAENVALFNGKEGDPASFELLDRLLDEQPYRLAFWKSGRDEINYRRFFDISDMVGLRVEDPDVFEASHALVFRLLAEGRIMGLRIDHIDGLYDPLEYLRRLRRRAAPEEPYSTAGSADFHLVVEKILCGDESLPEEWPVSGTTGYDFLGKVNALLVDGDGLNRLDSLYAEVTGSRPSFETVAYEKKRQVADDLFAAEVRSLGHHLTHLAGQNRPDLRRSGAELTRALVAVSCCLPVYRTYTRTPEVSPENRSYVEHAFRDARRRDPTLDAGALRFLREVLLLEFPAAATRQHRDLALEFVMRWQQFTGPLMAKGVEDTALYTYNRLISLNEVGGDPGATPLSVEAFHAWIMRRGAAWPGTLNATSTHDTKRGEDVRARLNVLSEMPQAWKRHLRRWLALNAAKKRNVGGQPVPDPNTEVFLYQDLLGAWPLSPEDVPAFKDRFKDHAIKAAREAKSSTNWLSPDLQYEKALVDFVESILDPRGSSEFLSDLEKLHREMALHGAVNSLAQAVLKVTCPGVPDFYQGTELWDLNLVDPDNRRPVDFRKRAKLLDRLLREEGRDRRDMVRQLLASWQDGRVKLYLTYRLLQLRRANPELFLLGDYLPLPAQGPRRDNVCAFARRHRSQWALIAVPRLTCQLTPPGSFPLGQQVWQDDLLPIPEDAPQRWRNSITGEVVTCSPPNRVLSLSDLLRTFPAAVLEGSAA